MVTMCELKMKNIKRLLIIDDDLDLLMLLERRLVKEGYEIETAAHISEAEEIMGAFNPHLVLLDININGEDGRKLCWKIKMSEADKSAKVILITGFDYSKGRALLFGADDLVPKPLHMDYLLHKLDVHLLPNIAEEIKFS